METETVFICTDKLCFEFSELKENKSIEVVINFNPVQDTEMLYLMRQLVKYNRSL